MDLGYRLSPKTFVILVCLESEICMYVVVYSGETVTAWDIVQSRPTKKKREVG